ncbi:MAG TPA: CYTH domain-containing protein [archaeon]|nr:CYTH domain-containing protein [archaeon]
MPLEIEAKFEITDIAVYEMLCKLRSLGGDTLHASRKKQTDIYLDTEDRAIKKSGASYRIRDGKEVTLKRNSKKESGRFEREEIVYAISSDLIGALKTYDLDAPVVKAAQEITKGSPLSEVLTVENNRTTLTIDGVEIAVDNVTYKSGERTAHSYELEIESKGASSETIEKISALLKQMFGDFLVPSEESKYERGLKLLREK